MPMPFKFTPTVLTIAGSDPYGGAGLEIDSKVIHALGGYAFCVTTAITAQNSIGVTAVQSTEHEIFRQQLETLLDDVKVDAVKIGMLANAELIGIVVEAIDKYALKNIVLDTVLVSSSGKILLETDAMDLMVKELFPRVDLITPNLPEINRFLNTSYDGKKDEMSEIASSFFDKDVKAILIKGGHSSNEEEAIDYWVSDTLEMKAFSTKRVNTSHTHGTGCFLSSSIATSLAKGLNMEESIVRSKDFLYERLNASSSIKFNYLEKNVIRKEPLL